MDFSFVHILDYIFCSFDKFNCHAHDCEFLEPSIEHSDVLQRPRQVYDRSKSDWVHQKDPRYILIRR